MVGPSLLWYPKGTHAKEHFEDPRPSWGVFRPRIEQVKHAELHPSARAERIANVGVHEIGCGRAARVVFGKRIAPEVTEAHGREHATGLRLIRHPTVRQAFDAPRLTIGALAEGLDIPRGTLAAYITGKRRTPARLPGDSRPCSGSMRRSWRPWRVRSRRWSSRRQVVAREASGDSNDDEQCS